MPGRRPLPVLALCVAVAGFAAPAAIAAPPAGSVKIINTTAESVPVLVQNALSVTGTVTIGAPVEIDDSNPLRVTPVEAAEERVQIFRSLNSGLDFLYQEEILEVPAGKRFIAEQVNGEALTHADGNIKVQWAAHSTRSGVPVSQTFVVPLTHQFTDSFRRMSYNEPMSFQVEGPGSVVVSLQRFGPRLSTEVASGTSLVGRMVDCESCQPPRE